MMFLIRFWRSLTKKDSVESAKYEMQIFSFCTSVFGQGVFFFTDPDFSGSDPKFWPMDPDSGKKADLDPEKNPNAKHCINSIISLFLPN